MISRRGERWLATLLLGLWAVCALASAITIRRGTGFPPIFVDGASSADGGPIVSGMRPTLLGGTPGDLRPGDAVLRIGAADMRGEGPVGFFVRFVAQARADRPLEVEYERAGVRATTAVGPASTLLFLPLLLASPVFALVAVVLWRRAPENVPARAFVLALTNQAFYLAGNFASVPFMTYASMGVHVATMTLVGPLTLRAFLLFPDRTSLSPSERGWPWLFAVLGLLHTAHLGWPVPPRLGNAAAGLVVVVMLVACVTVATRAYRRADPVGRRRLKWVLLGAYGAAMPPIATALLSAANPGFINIYFLSLAAIACLPLALLIAIVRVNLFDVDRILSVAGSYNLLIAGGVVIGVTVVPRAAEAGAELLGIDSGLGQLALSGVLGLTVYFLHRRLRPRIEGVFFAERHALDSGVQELLVRLRRARDFETLVHEMADTLDRLVRPESCVVYARSADVFTPLVAHGQVVPPALTLESALLGTLRDRRAPLALGGEPGEMTPAPDPFERAVLDTLDASVIAPGWCADQLAFLLCLGAKRSGDVYTPTDVRLVGTVAETASLRLDHFAQSEIIAQTRRMRDTLRRYLPAPVAEALGQGTNLDAAERDVTVVFVDLRGYTALCDQMGSQAVFDLTSQYTATVSAVLRRYHGNLVEFSGDGLMAIFGAPQPLRDKEAKAVLAARELVDALRAHGPRGPDGAPLAVGIGIATGRAHCGNIRSADQVIWTAIGNIVNLAARLQSFTREIDVTIAIDAATFRLAGSVAADFELRQDVRIRGRREPEVVYTSTWRHAVAAA